MYRVLRDFYDLEDFMETKAGRAYHEYRAGDVYPRKGVTPSSGRVELLAGPDNAQGTPLIEWDGPVTEAVPEPVPEAEESAAADQEAVAEAPEPSAEEPTPAPKKPRKRKTEA